MRRLMVGVVLIGLWALSARAGRPVLALLTDFGIENEAVGLCHGAVLAIDADIVVVDLCHQVQPYNVRQAGMMVSRVKGFPKGSVFVAVVDPGVGTDRRAVAIETEEGHFFVAPDNGLLSEVIRRGGVVRAVEVDPKKVNPDWSPGTFDGRDLFAPAGAWIAATSGDLERVGSPLSVEDLVVLDPIQPVLLEDPKRVRGCYLRTDEPYGNIWTNIGPAELEAVGVAVGDRIEVAADGRTWEVPVVVSFGHVPPGAALAYLDSEGKLALAINQGNAQKAFGLVEGAELVIRKAGSSP